MLLPGHDVKSAAEMGWSELTNGEIMAAAERDGFDAMVTADRNLVYQQNLAGRKLGLVVLSTNHWPTLETGADLVLQVLQSLRAVGAGYIEVSLPRPKLRRKKPPAPKPG
jgi:hypothetical protein